MEISNTTMKISDYWPNYKKCLNDRTSNISPHLRALISYPITKDEEHWLFENRVGFLGNPERFPSNSIRYKAKKRVLELGIKENVKVGEIEVENSKFRDQLEIETIKLLNEHVDSINKKFESEFGKPNVLKKFDGWM